MKKESSVIVSVQCLTYNHKDYLRQALDSFLKQETDFAFEVIVHDDASTDGTAEILKEYAERYPRIVLPIFEQENLWSKNGLNVIFARMTEMSRGKYIAYCEGDDFWQDPLKLQKQVDAMERCPEATFCYTGFQTVDNDGKAYRRKEYESWNGNGVSGEMFFKLLENNMVLTPTTLFRKEVFTSAIYLNTPLRLDYFAFLSAAALGTAIYLPERTACYRQTPTGAMATQLPWVKEKYFAIREYFILEYALGHIRKPFSMAGMKTLVEALNMSIRKKAAGDAAQLHKLLTDRTMLRFLYPLAWMQVKCQNWKFNHSKK